MNIKNYIGRQTGLSGLELNTNIRRGQMKTVGHEIGHGINLEHHPIDRIRCVMESGYDFDWSGAYPRLVLPGEYHPDHGLPSQYNHKVQYKFK